MLWARTQRSSPTSMCLLYWTYAQLGHFPCECLQLVSAFYEFQCPFLVCGTAPPAQCRPSIRLFHRPALKVSVRKNVKRNLHSHLYRWMNFFLPVAKTWVLKLLAHIFLSFFENHFVVVYPIRYSIAVASIWYRPNSPLHQTVQHPRRYSLKKIILNEQYGEKKEN